MSSAAAVPATSSARTKSPRRSRSRSNSHSRSRSPRSSKHRHHSSRSHHRSHHRSNSRNRSRSPHHRDDRHSHRRHRSKSRSRSRSPHRRRHDSSSSRHRRSRSPHSKHHFSPLHRRSSSPLSSSHVKKEPHDLHPQVKQEPREEESKSQQLSLSSYLNPQRIGLKSEPAPFKSESSSRRPAPSASTTQPMAKTENEPSDAEITAALESSAAAYNSNIIGVPRPQHPVAKAEPVKKAEINYGLSGKLAAAAASAAGISTDAKYVEPVDACLPTSDGWRLYIFKDGKPLDSPLRLHGRSYYMIGRDEKLCDIITAHPSCSNQHAVIQFRKREVQKEDGSMDYVVKPYLFDLGSTNGTHLMGQRREASKYYELLEKDLIKFGFSTREYVLLNTKK